MDRIFIHILLLPEWTLMFAGILCAILGGLIAAWRLTIRHSIGRLAFLWAKALFNVGVVALQLGGHAVPFAADLGLLWILITVIFTGAAGLGGMLYYASAARSMNMRGDSKYAWMGFVPIVALVLLFTPAMADQQKPMRGRMVRYVRNPILLVTALFAIIMGQALSKVLDETPAYDVVDSTTLVGLISGAMTVEEYFASESEGMRASLPMELDEVTTLTRVDAEGKSLEFVYVVSDHQPGVAMNSTSTLAEIVCPAESFGGPLSRGGQVIFTYRGPDETLIDRYVISVADCSA